MRLSSKLGIRRSANRARLRHCPSSSRPLRRASKVGATKKVGHLKSQLELAKEIIHQLDSAQDNRPLTPMETWVRNNLKKHSLVLASLIRTIARSRSRISWLRDGDANTALFHLQARHSQRNNFIAKLTNGDQVATTHDDKAQILFDFYMNLIGSREVQERSINLEALGIQQHDLAALDAPISEDEVWSVIKQLPSDKAPGPDGIMGRFYKTCWQTIKGDIMAAISVVWRRDFRHFRLLNLAFITLLPKWKGLLLPRTFGL